MGTDKALIPVNGETAVERQCRLLEPLCPQGVFVAGARFAPAPDFAWQVIQDQTPDSGPITGILSALRHAQRGIALIVAVDLWSLTPETVVTVVQAMTTQRGPDQSGVEQNEFDLSYTHSAADPTSMGAQPLCAAWRVETSLPIIAEQFDLGERSVMRAWSDLHRHPVSVPESHITNINTPPDMENFRQAKG
jgi:molybdopterin-guanine dinucleotide biosynthesis protein A